MIGFAKLQDDLAVIRVGLESAPLTSTNAAACAALIRVCEFAKTLENLDVHELPEAPPRRAKGWLAEGIASAVLDSTPEQRQRVKDHPSGFLPVSRCRACEDYPSQGPHLEHDASCEFNEPEDD